jgi:hypothetical protein
MVLPAPRPTTLGIGAGGNIRQHIERDTYDPRIWDLASSKILNVQIIDSRTFRLVTGFDPPETPITAQMYKDMGLSFFKLWHDEAKEHGVAGGWGSLMGVAEAASEGGMMAQSGGPEEDGPFAEERDDAGVEGFKEPSFDFPVVLLDVDSTLPPFRSVVEECEDGWGFNDV